MAKNKIFKKPKRLKMSKRSEKALDKSIEHWYRVRDENEYAEAEDCELCKIYQIGIRKKCIFCPIYLKTGINACGNTPYYPYARTNRYNITESKRKRLAQAEIEFLQSCYY